MMITRIVKMSFLPEKVESFIHLFEKHRQAISSVEGCRSLKLLRGNSSSLFFTVSEWEDEKYLENYRHSELFNTVWSNTKIFFNAKPEAWTTHQVE